MKNKRKVILYIAGGAIGLISIGLSLKFIANGRFVRRIPEISEAHALPVPVFDQIKEAKVKAKRNPSADNLGNLGMVYHSSANYEQAAACYKLAIEQDDSQWIWNYYLGYLHAEMSESNSILENFNRVIEINPENYHAWYYCGEEYMNLREFDQAEKYFGEIRSIIKPNISGNPSAREDRYPLGTYAMFQLSNIYFNTGRIDLAEQTLQELIQTSRTFGPGYRLLGNIYRTKGDIPLSDQYGAKANDLMAYSPPVDTLIDRLALLSRSELYLLKKIDEAVNAIYSQWALRLVNHGMQYMPQSKYLTSKAIKTCLWMDLEEQAISYVDRHISLSQNDFHELFSMGMSFFERELYPSSLKYWHKTLELTPGDLDIHMKLAICDHHMGEQQKSIDRLVALLVKNPDNLDLLADVAEIMFFDINEITKANGYLAILEHYMPSDPKVQKMLAWKAEKNGKIHEAINLYESSFRGNPEDLTTIKNLGRLLFDQKMWDKSIRHFREALVYNSNEPYILERLGTLLIMCPDPAHKDVQEGMVYAERALMHISSRPLTKIASGRSLALAHAMLGDKQTAYGVINMILEIARGEGYSRENVAELEYFAKVIQNMGDETVVVTQ